MDFKTYQSQLSQLSARFNLMVCLVFGLLVSNVVLSCFVYKAWNHHTVEITPFSGTPSYLKSASIVDSHYLSLMTENFIKNDLPLILDVNNELIRDWREKLKNKSDGLKILLFRGKVQELKKFDDSGLFDLIVSGSTNDDELNQVLKISTGSSDIPMIPTKGQGIISAKIN